MGINVGKTEREGALVDGCVNFGLLLLSVVIKRIGLDKVPNCCFPLQ